MTIFVSEAVGAERLPFVAGRPPITARIRRWKQLAALYREGLQACGLPVTPILRPEIYQSDVAREACNAKPGDWHMAIKPLEHLRPFHGLINVFVCDWAHPVLSTNSGPGAPFLNHARVLRQAEIVACCSEATALAVHRAGLHHVVYLPPFIADPARSGRPLQRTSPPGECVCLAFMDADGPAYTWASLLQGFAMARRRNERLRLSVAVDGTATTDALRSDMLSRFAVEDVGDSISFSAAHQEGAVAHMAPLADFFLDVSPLGGFPVSLVQAMRSGLPPIAARGAWLEPSEEAYVRATTVMGDVAVSEEPAAAVMRLRSERPDALSVCEALLAATSLSPPDRLAMAEAGRRFAETRFGLESFRRALHHMLNQHPGLLR